MIYPKNYESKIGFDEIRHLLKGFCLSTLGQEKVDDITICTDADTVNEWLEQIREFRRIKREAEAFPLSYFFDVRQSILRIRLENTHLEEDEVWDLRRSLDTITNIVKFLNDAEEDITDPIAHMALVEYRYPALQRLTEGIQSFPAMIRRIDSILDKFGKIKDSASMTLAGIRHDMEQTAGSISRTLYSILHTAQREGLVDKDVAPTMRDGRLVIPVAPGLKRRIKGIVHDESATGKTVFIEPTEVVEANNKVRELEAAERREIIRILTVFSDEVRPHIQEILESYKFLAQIDLIQAKAELAETMSAFEPKVVVGVPHLDWVRAIHPLLQCSLAKQDKKAIPLDITLTKEKRLLIISGPNAGGKSVCLKTVGLLQYMLQCGLSIPIGDRSMVGLFQHIMIDIGDEQSIELSLSTFSSHMTNIVKILANATAKSLVLFDELGGGTDPTEGAALAIAILSHLHAMGAHIAATTHYSELKVFALSAPGVENACCEFDIETLKPTYRLLIGVPGKSNAFAISKKLGLPDEIIEAAKQEIDESSMDFERLLSDLEKSRITIKEEQEHAEALRLEVEDLKASAKQTTDDIKKRKDKILKDARQEAKDILEKAKASADESIRLYNKWAKNPEKANNKAMEQQRTHLRNDLNKLDNQLIEKPKKKKVKATDYTFKEGDYVYIDSMGLEGEIVSNPDKKGDCYVQAGILKTLVNTVDLKLIDAPKEDAKPVTHAAKQLDLRANVSTEINLLGKTVDEAISVLDKYLDDAYLARLNSVTIIHGKGTGALRSAVQDYLKHQKNVKSFRAGAYGEGEAGVTVVEFK